MSLVGNSHLVAGTAACIPDVLTLLEGEGFPAGSPDLFVRTYAHFGIDEARELRERAILTASGERRAFVVAAPGMTSEAQNALLKTLEEPPGGALFFFIVSSPETLLPTLRSRTQMLSIGGVAVAGAMSAKEFLASHPAKRLDMLKPLLEKGEDERRDLSAIVELLASLERYLAGTSKEREGLDAIYRARKYIGDKGSLIKPLLEQVALLTPVI